MIDLEKRHVMVKQGVRNATTKGVVKKKKTMAKVASLATNSASDLRAALALAEEREAASAASSAAVHLRSRNYPDYLWKVMSSERVVINQGASATKVQIVPGLYRPGDEEEAHDFNAPLFQQHGRGKMVSFIVEDGPQAGSFLRHCGWDLRAHREESSPLFRLDATFYMEEDCFFPGTVAFHSINYDRHYISHRSYCLKIASIAQRSRNLHRNDASFSIEHAI
jgi:hypothetical protein